MSTPSPVRSGSLCLCLVLALLLPAGAALAQEPELQLLSSVPSVTKPC